MLNIKNLDHIGIIVCDVEASAAWYMKMAEFSKLGAFDVNGSKIVFVKNDESGVMIELIQRPEDSEQAKKAKNNNGFIDHIAFGTEDIKKQAEEANKMELEIIEGPTFVPEIWENGVEILFVKSVTGEKIEYCKKL